MAGKALQVTGIKEFEKSMRSLAEKYQKTVIRQSLQAATKPVVKAAKARVPNESGTLKKALGGNTKAIGKREKTAKGFRFKGTGQFIALVGARKQVVGIHKGKKRWPVKYLHLVEQGVPALNIPARPFLRPAMSSAASASLAAFGAKFGPALDKQIRKSRIRAAKLK